VGAGKPKEALPYLERALAAGEVDAGYTLGTAYVQLGNKAKAVEQLEAYLRKRPDDKGAATLLEAVRAGKVKMKSTAD
jgi:predicted Zn-dependent protease